MNGIGGPGYGLAMLALTESWNAIAEIGRNMAGDPEGATTTPPPADARPGSTQPTPGRGMLAAQDGPETGTVREQAYGSAPPAEASRTLAGLAPPRFLPMTTAGAALARPDAEPDAADAADPPPPRSPDPQASAPASRAQQAAAIGPPRDPSGPAPMNGATAGTTPNPASAANVAERRLSAAQGSAERTGDRDEDTPAQPSAGGASPRTASSRIAVPVAMGGRASEEAEDVGSATRSGPDARSPSAVAERNAAARDPHDIREGLSDTSSTAAAEGPGRASAAAREASGMSVATERTANSLAAAERNAASSDLAAGILGGTVGELQVERAGIIASFVLNAAMIPGWPPPRPFAVPELDNALVRSLVPGASAPASEADLVDYLGKLGLDSALLERVKAWLAKLKRSRRKKILLGLAVVLTAFRSALESVGEELERLREELGLEEDEDEPERRFVA